MKSQNFTESDSHCSIRPLPHEFKITLSSIWTSFNIQQINCAQLDTIKSWIKDAKTPDRRPDYNGSKPR